MDYRDKHGNDGSVPIARKTFPLPVIARLVLAIHLLQIAAMRYGYVYLICNRKNGTIYLGMTSDLGERIEQHKSKANPNSFSAKYETCRLVWFERHDLITDAITQEKTMKGWPRQWKINLIERDNPNWDELIVEFDD